MEYTLHERAQRAYNNGDIELFNAIVELEEALETIDKLEEKIADTVTLEQWEEEKIADTVTLEQWEEENGPASSYVEFFNDCFQHLDGHYPCPSVTSDHDKSVIFDAISGVNTPSEADIKTMQDNAYWSGFADGREKP